jgi:hypothetical protein
MRHMLKNPFLNAIMAAGYIVAIVLGVINATDGTGADNSIFAPIAMLSLLVLSVAVMAFLFFAEPVRMFVDGRKDEALTFFLKTLGTFAVIAGAFVAIFISIAR